MVKDILPDQPEERRKRSRLCALRAMDRLGLLGEENLIPTLARRPDLRWLADEGGARWAVLTELGRIGESGAFEEAVEWALENQPSLEEATAYIRRFRLRRYRPAGSSGVGRRPVAKAGPLSDRSPPRATGKDERGDARIVHARAAPADEKDNGAPEASRLPSQDRLGHGRLGGYPPRGKDCGGLGADDQIRTAPSPPRASNARLLPRNTRLSYSIRTGQERSGRLLQTKVERMRAARATVAQAHLRIGRTDKAIVDLAEELEADLVATGSQRLDGMRRALMGSVSDSVVRHAYCPVMVVRH
jgi:nucleotide-binding universal stress UspA family protein